MITTLVGKVLGDMTAESHRMVMKCKCTEPKDPLDPLRTLMADDV
jgi:hypothetical protein